MDASVLVLTSRSHGGIMGLIKGSVADYVVQHCDWSVVGWGGVGWGGPAHDCVSSNCCRITHAHACISLCRAYYSAARWLCCTPLRPTSTAHRPPYRYTPDTWWCL
jgi:hypothetical protein